MRSKQYFTSIKNNPHEISTDPKIFRRISANYKEDKTKATSNFHCLSPYVGMRRLERPTPTSRT